MERKTLEFNVDKFMSDIREKTGKKSLRDIASLVDTSASTLSRIDNGNEPDMKTFIKICEQLELNVGDYFIWYEWTLKPVIPPYKEG